MTDTTDILHPQALVVPKYANATRDTFAAEIGMLIFSTGNIKLQFNDSAVVGGGSWHTVTSA